MPRTDQVALGEFSRRIAGPFGIGTSSRESFLHGDSSRSRLEDDVLLLCSRTQVTPERAERLSIIVRSGLDWDYLLRKASLHRVIPLLYRALHSVCSDAVPRDVMLRLHAETRTIAIHNHLLVKECIPVLTAFERSEIPVLVFKGPALGYALYRDQHLRPFEDVDVLIRREDFTACKSLLAEHGFRSFRDMSNEEETAYLDAKFAFPFLKTSHGLVVNIELHWALTHRKFPFDANPHGLFESAEQIFLDDYPTRTFEAQDLLLFLCVHGAKHYWQRLIWICDVSELLHDSPRLEWEQLFERARGAGSLRMLFVGLLLAHHLLDAELPPHVVERLHSERRAVDIACRISTWLLDREDPLPSRKERARFHPQIRERLRDKVPAQLQNLRLAVTPSAKDRSFVQLPPSLRLLYYVVRPVRSLFEYLGR